jgi:hypothetical protein
VKRVREEHSKLDGELQQIANAVVNAYFSVPKSYPSMKAQWEELRRLGLYSDRLDMFRKRIRAGRPMCDLLFPRWGTAFVNANCTPEQRARAEAILRRIEELTAEEEQAEKLIERVPFVPSPGL